MYSAPIFLFILFSITTKLILSLPSLYRDCQSVRDFFNQIFFFLLVDRLCNYSSEAYILYSITNIVAVAILIKFCDPRGVS